jgi:hypothetical protein
MVGLEPWRLAGATGPRVATGSPGSVATLKDAGLGVEVAYVSERYAGRSQQRAAPPKMLRSSLRCVSSCSLRSSAATAVALVEANFSSRAVGLSDGRLTQHLLRSRSTDRDHC